MNNSYNHTVKVNIKGINWDLDDEIEDNPDINYNEIGLPKNIDGYIVVKSSIYDPYEKWTEDNGTTGFDFLMNDILEELSNEFGFCIDSIEEIEIIE